MQPFKASLDNYELLILDISDTISASIVKQEFVNTDGAKITNFGNKAREIKFRALFFGPTRPKGEQSPATYQNHYYFVKEMSDSAQTHVLIHPKYGRIEGVVESLGITHDDTQDYVAIDINFVQKDIQVAGFISDTESVATIVRMANVALLNNAIAKARQSITQAGLGAVANIPIDSTKSVLSQISGVGHNISQATRNFCKECDIFLNYMDSYAAAITSPLNSIDAAVNYVGDLPSRIIGSINGVCNRIVGSLVAISNLPVSIINSIVVNSKILQSTITGEHAQFFHTQLLNVTSGAISREASVLLQNDNVQTDIARQTETTSVFNAKGNRVATASIEQTMTLQDLELMLYTVRDYVQTAINNDRSNLQLMTMLKALVDFVNNIKLTKRKQITVTVNSMPLHLLCMQLGLPYNMAERLYKLNPDIKNPTFCEGAIKVYTNA